MSGTTSSASSGGGQFQVENGQIYNPSGGVFTDKGIALQDSQMGDANQVLADFPGLDFVRLAVYSYQSPSAYASFIQTMTSHGVVVELEDHTNSAGADDGGSVGAAFSGSQLSNELSWYSSMAGAYASNPDVWFGTDNEPPSGGLSQWEQQTYNAIRDAGNNAPIVMELPGGGQPGFQNATDYGLDPSVYASMSNIVVDVHFYGWSSNYSTDQSTVNNTLSGLVQGAQTIPSANGTPAVIVGEYGISTDGSSDDDNGNQVLQAVQQSGQISGGTAWAFTGAADSLTDGNGNLTGYGQEVAQWIASGAQNNGATSATTASGASTTSTTSTASTASTASTGDNSSSDAPGNTITFSGSNAWQSALSGNTAFFIDGSNNTIDLSGGGSTVTDNANANTFILPTASTGSANFTNDIFNLGDTLNLQTALAATDWDGSASDLGNYLSVADTSGGATLSIASTAGGSSTPIATIAGETNLNLSGLLSHAIT